MGEVMSFPGITRAQASSPSTDRYSGAVEILEDDRLGAVARLAEIVWMQGWQERGAKRSRRQPGRPAIRIDQKGLLLEWKSGRGSGRQELCLYFSYEQLAELNHVVGRIVELKARADDLTERGVEQVWERI